MSAMVVEEVGVMRRVTVCPRVQVEAQLVIALLGDAGVAEKDVD